MLLPPRIQIAACLVLAAVCSWLFYARYWAWRDCIRASTSGCVTPDGDNLTSGGMIWGLLAAALAAVAVRLLLFGWTWRKPTRPPV